MLRWVRDTLEGFHEGAPKQGFPPRRVALKAAGRAFRTTRADADITEIDQATKLLTGSVEDPCKDGTSFSLLNVLDCPAELAVHLAETELRDAVEKTLDELAKSCVVLDGDGKPVWTTVDGVEVLTWKDPNTCRIEKAFSEFVCALHDELWRFRIALRALLFTSSGMQLAAAVAYDPARLVRLREAFREHVGGMLHLTEAFGRFADAFPYDYDEEDSTHSELGAPVGGDPSDKARARRGIARLLREALHVPGSVEDHLGEGENRQAGMATGAPELFLDGMFVVAVVSALYTLQDCSAMGKHAKEMNLHLWKALGMLVRKERRFCIQADSGDDTSSEPPPAEDAPTDGAAAMIEQSQEHDMGDGACGTEGLVVHYVHTSQLSSLLAVERRFRDVRVVQVMSSIIDKALIGNVLKDFPLDVLYGHIPVLAELGESFPSSSTSP